MESFDERCTPLKEQYDACFNSWYSDKFLRGDTSEDGCAQLFKVYRECLAEALEKRGFNMDELEVSVLEKNDLKHLDPPADSSTIVQREGASSQAQGEEKNPS